MVSSTLRGLGRDTASTAVAVLVMALGIGSVTAMFSVVNAVALRPLAIGDPDRVFEVRTMNGTIDSGVASGDFDRLRAVPGVISAMLAGTSAVTLTGREGAENVFSQKLAGDGLAVYGVKPEIGTLSSEDRSAVISYRLWKRRYNSDPGIAGRAVTINGEGWTIAAVMPERFAAGNRADVWMPWRFTAQDLERHGEGVSGFVMRLAAGAPAGTVEAGLGNAAREFQPERFAKLKIKLVPIAERQLGNHRATLGALLGAVGLVLLVACLNAGSLLVARGLARHRETAVRAALGASRWELLKPVIAESAVLAMIAALTGSALAWVLVRTLPALLPERLPLPRLGEASIDASALAVAVVAAAVCIFLASLAPAVTALRVDPASAFGSSNSRSATASRASVRFGAASAVLQTALSVTLLIGAGLLLRSFYLMIQTDPGYDREGVLTARVPMPFDLGQRYGGAAQVEHYRNVLDAVRAVPGVRYAAVTTVLPLGRVGASTDFVPEGRPAPRQPEYVQAYGVSPDYFRVMGIPLRAGRLFDDRDTIGSDAVLVINEVTARKYWPGEDPVGKRVQGRKPMTVVGVVGSVRRGSMREPPKEEAYRPLPQFLFALHGTTLVVRTAGPPPETLAAPVRAVLTEKFPDHPVAEVRPMTAWIDESVAEPRFFAGLLSGFSGLALAIAAAGLYGLLAQVAALRRREIGIRIAVGAQPGQVTWLLVGRGLAVVAAGVALGAAGSLAMTRVLRSQLYGVEPDDPATLLGVAALFTIVALAAMAIPAWRAGRADPASVLRAE